MRQFAEQEIVIPDGPFAGRRFRCDRQPYTELWFDQVDSRRWNRCVATGPTQSGKSLSCFVIPILYHLFEVGETVICGLPDMDMAGDKWRKDLLPVIERSQFRDLLPSSGGGSRGGRVESLQFANGATLKFMSGGGSDKSRSHFTSRVVVITETDGMDTPGQASRETDKVTQMEARTRAYGSRKRIYMECTVSTEAGKTWREYSSGSKSRLVLPCASCHAWVTPEREHLTGWQGAENEQAAKAMGGFTCPSCGVVWSDSERIVANHNAKLLHDGQSMDEQGVVVGEIPPTGTLGFRWSGVNNLFATCGELAADEWRASRAPDEETAEREMRQFVWCIPVKPAALSQTDLQVHELTGRVREPGRGIVPAGWPLVTVGVDLGKYLAHWVAVAWPLRDGAEQIRDAGGLVQAGAGGQVIDYGRLEVASADLGVEPAIMNVLREMKEMVEMGWPVSGKGAGEEDVQRLVPEQVFIDAGYQTPVVYGFCREAGQRFRPAVGRGVGQLGSKRAVLDRTSQTGSVVRLVGEGYHAAWLPAEQLYLVESDADHWKSWVHQRLATPLDAPGAMTIYRPATPHEHFAFAKHLTAEVRVEEFIAGKGVVVRWERIRRQNHWLDALYNACVAGHGCGVRLVDERVPEKPAPQPRNPEHYASDSPYGPNGWLQNQWRDYLAEAREQWRRW